MSKTFYNNQLNEIVLRCFIHFFFGRKAIHFSPIRIALPITYWTQYTKDGTWTEQKNVFETNRGMEIKLVGNWFPRLFFFLLSASASMLTVIPSSSPSGFLQNWPKAEIRLVHRHVSQATAYDPGSLEQAEETYMTETWIWQPSLLVFIQTC